MNVDQNRMLSLTVKVLFSYSHFQKSRENPYYIILNIVGMSDDFLKMQVAKK